MKYPYKHPRLYGEAAMQGLEKKTLAASLGITMYQMRNRQDPNSTADFDAGQMKRASDVLHKPVTELFDFGTNTRDSA